MIANQLVFVRQINSRSYMYIYSSRMWMVDSTSIMNSDSVLLYFFCGKYLTNSSQSANNVMDRVNEQLAAL